MRCSKCNYDNPDSAKFCQECGNKLEFLKACSNEECPDYGKAILPQEAKFCPRCGEKIDNKKERTGEINPLFSSLTNEELNRYFKIK